MSQAQFILLAFKVVDVASVVTITAFVGCYTWWTRGKCWSNPIGQTIVAKDLALVLILIPSILSIFVDFNRLTSHIAAWFDVASFAAVPVIMTWRILAWRKIHQAGGLGQDGDNEGERRCLSA